MLTKLGDGNVIETTYVHQIVHGSSVNLAENNADQVESYEEPPSISRHRVIIMQIISERKATKFDQQNVVHTSR